VRSASYSDLYLRLMRGSCFIEEVTDSDKESGDRITEVDLDLEDKRTSNEDLVRKHRAASSGLLSRDIAVLETNKAPTLRTADRKDILLFMQKREKYIQVHLDAGLDKIRLRTLVSMFEQVFLETICQYELGISFIEVTDKDLEDWMAEKLRQDRSRDVLLDEIHVSGSRLREGAAQWGQAV
jgi:hypothetical protein